MERFGKPPERGWHLDSGPHVKLPWPFESVRRFPSKRVLTVNIGHHGDHSDAPPPAILWTVPHYEKEDYFLLASRDATASGEGAAASVPVNLLVLSVPVEYRITNVLQYGYGFAEPQLVLQQVIYRAASRQAAGSDLFSILGEGQLAAAPALQAAIQAEADHLQLGVEILFVGLQGVHPPTPIADAFEDVVGALEDREALILTAQAYKRGILPVAHAEAAAQQLAAEAARVRRTALAEAEAYRFSRQLLAARRSPQVFRSRTYLDALENALGGARKYIIAADTPYSVFQFDFEEKLRPDLFDFGPSAIPTRGGGL